MKLPVSNSFPAMLFSLVWFFTTAAAEKEALTEVGVANIDITPAYPVRLSGYAVRKKESEAVAQQLWAKALAIGSALASGGLVPRLRKLLADCPGLELRLATRKNIPECFVTEISTTFVHTVPNTEICAEIGLFKTLFQLISFGFY